MFYPKRQLAVTWIAAILAGCVLHFLYEWQPNAVTALFSPVNESLWEHVKLVFWPFLGAALYLNRGRPGGTRPWLLMLPLLSALTLLLGWVYHVTLGGEAMWVDITLFVLVMTLGFWLATRFSGPLPCSSAGSPSIPPRDCSSGTCPPWAPGCLCPVKINCFPRSFLVY